MESVATRIPNVDLFVSMYVRKEALMSSQIEGTQATLEDVLDPMLGANTNRNVADVVNYVKATEFAIKRLQTLPLCNRLIRETHAVLMEGVRGQEKSPGEFRYSQNWIGGQGSTLKNARYIPPSPYISCFLKKNRVEYYDRMTEIRVKGNYEQWVKFFLQAIMESSEDAIATIDELIAFHDANVAVISKQGRAAKNAMLVFSYLESNPIIEIKKTADALGITFNTTSSAVNRLVDAGVLIQTSGNSRNRTFAYEAYLNILRKDT